MSGRYAVAERRDVKYRAATGTDGTGRLPTAMPRDSSTGTAQDRMGDVGRARQWHRSVWDGTRTLAFGRDRNGREWTYGTAMQRDSSVEERRSFALESAARVFAATAGYGIARVVSATAG